MIALLASLLAPALAGPPPPGVDPDDLDTWEARARALRDGPTRCWVLEGVVASKVAVFTPPSLWTKSERHDLVYEGTFEGTFEKGRWQRFVHDTKRVDDTVSAAVFDFDMPVRPMVGAIDEGAIVHEKPDAPEAESPGDEAGDDAGEDGEAESGGGSTVIRVESGASDSARNSINMVDDVIDSLEPTSLTSYAEWSDDPRGIRLLQDVPLTSSRNAPTVTLETFVPDGGPVATEVDVTFPRRYRVGEGMVKVVLMEPQMRLRGRAVGEETLPVAEALSMVVGAMGFTVGIEQSLRYTKATACPAQ